MLACGVHVVRVCFRLFQSSRRTGDPLLPCLGRLHGKRRCYDPSASSRGGTSSDVSAHTKNVIAGGDREPTPQRDVPRVLRAAARSHAPYRRAPRSRCALRLPAAAHSSNAQSPPPRRRAEPHIDSQFPSQLIRTIRVARAAPPRLAAGRSRRRGGSEANDVSTPSQPRCGGRISSTRGMSRRLRVHARTPAARAPGEGGSHRAWKASRAARSVSK